MSDETYETQYEKPNKQRYAETITAGEEGENTPGASEAAETDDGGSEIDPVGGIEGGTSIDPDGAAETTEDDPTIDIPH